jgi:hypothetical protein
MGREIELVRDRLLSGIVCSKRKPRKKRTKLVTEAYLKQLDC